MAFRLVLVLLGLSCVRGFAQTDQTQTIPSQKPTIEVSIAAPERGGRDRHAGQLIIRLTKDSHIDVVIRNVSNQPLDFCSEPCSGGCCGLHLELFSIDDKLLPKPIIVERSVTMWASNVSGIIDTLEPGAVMVREVHFTKDSPAAVFREPYQNFPAIKDSEAHKIRMRAVFTVPAGVSGDDPKAWTGSVASETHDYIVW